jgi:magnesium-transporting ATPase (P-type)
MNQDHPTDSIQDAVLEKIRGGDVRRRPRWQFALRMVSVVFVSILLLIAASLVISFIFFSIHESGEQFLLGYGANGIATFLTLFPWTFGLIAIGLVFLLEWLLRGFTIGYRMPLLNIFFLVVAVSIVLGLLITATPLHSVLYGFAQQDKLPLIGQSYEHVMDHHDDVGVARGKVISVEKYSFTIQHNDNDRNKDEGTILIQVPEDGSVQLPSLGDQVLIFGEPSQGSIRARNIELLPGL